MALQDNYTPVVTRGNGTTVNFSYSFDMIASTFAVVNLRAVATGVRTLQELNVDYTITVSENGGIVTMADAPTSDYDVIVERSVPAVQDVPYKTSTGFQGSVVERSFDKVVAVLQELLDVADRAVRTDVDGDEGLIFPNAEANKIIGWNADGDALENKDELDADTVASVQAFADAAANSAEEAEAAADIAVQAAADAIEAAELIADLEVASEAEAQAGTDNTKVTTPLRVFQGIAAYADANFLTTPSEAPDADYEVANKKYVDDKVETDGVYDSGWFSIAAASTIAKTHNLGTTNVVSMFWLSQSSNGSNAYSSFTWNENGVVFGSMLKNLTTTSITFQGGKTRPAGTLDDSGYSVTYTSGYARIVLIALK
jgi:hypothetical protein